MIKKYELQKGKMWVKYKAFSKQTNKQKHTNQTTTRKCEKLNGIREKFLPPKTHHLS